MTVLLVDDSHLFANSLRRVLQTRGVQSLMVAPNRLQAADLLSPKVRAVLVDFNLGSQDPRGGAVFLEHLERVGHTAFRVLLTGHETAAIRATAARHRAVWLLKGEPIDTLLDLLTIAGVYVRNGSGAHLVTCRSTQAPNGARRDGNGRWHSHGRQAFSRVIEMLTLTKVAEVLKLTSAMVSALSVGARQPSLRLAVAIEHHFGIVAHSWVAAPVDDSHQLPVDTNQYLVDAKDGTVR